MQIRRIWEFLGARMTRTPQRSKSKKAVRSRQFSRQPVDGLFHFPTVHIGGYACSVYDSLDLYS